MVGPEPDPKDLEHAFRWEVLKMLKDEGKITDLVIENMLSWYNSGFNVYCGIPVRPSDKDGLERLAQYIIRAPISQERMTYIPASEAADGIARVIYDAKDGSASKTFLAIDWLAQLITHIPNKGEQTVRYYGYYSNKSRGMRKKAGTDDEIPALIDTDISRKEFRRNWARLIRKVYNADPLICPKCSGGMRIISFIEDGAVIKMILRHLNLWETRNHSSPEGKIIAGYVPDSEVIPDNQQYPDDNQEFYNDDYCDQPFEDDYSQVTDDDYLQIADYAD
jgi:hypothetical protein